MTNKKKKKKRRWIEKKKEKREKKKEKEKKKKKKKKNKKKNWKEEGEQEQEDEEEEDREQQKEKQDEQQEEDEQEQEEHQEENFFHVETRLKITFLQLTSGFHVTISKDGCSWNDSRQPVFAVTPLFTRFYFNARLGRHFRHRSYGNCKGYDNTQTWSEPRLKTKIG